MENYVTAGLLTSFLTLSAVGSASAGIDAEDNTRVNRHSQQSEMQPRACKWEGDYMYCEVLANCREDEELQMSICDIQIVKRFDP